MAGQQFVFAEAIIGMKKAVARYDASDEDDSAAEIVRSVQHKLKRKAPQTPSILDNGRFIYKKPRIEHAGYKRHIIARNPPLIDEDGDEIEDVDDDESLDGSLAEDNPYGDIRLEELLAPLTSASELDTHPSMSIPYYSKHITELANNSRQVLQREEKSLWRAKAMMQKLLGDDTWLPVGLLETDYDREILRGPDPTGATASASTGSLDADNAEERGTSWEDQNMQENPQLVSVQQAVPQGQAQDGDVQMENGADVPSATEESQQNAQSNGTHSNQKEDASFQTQEHGESERGGQVTNGDVLKEENQSASAGSSADKIQVDGANGVAGEGATEPRSPRSDEENNSQYFARRVRERAARGRAQGNDTNGDIEEGTTEARSDDDEESNSQHFARRIRERAARTRAQQAQANSHTPSPPGSQRTPSPESLEEPPIHPIYKFPVDNLVDRDMGLPAHEAEDTRTWLLMYIQKQEECVRQTRALYMGLMEADRKRKMVLKWAKAEGHVGEMSDGEDWVDKEEWGLTEDLVKGKEEEEEEGVVQGKKTRARRREEK